jgi:hypothetical protein
MTDLAQPGRESLPVYVLDAIREALPAFERQIAGFSMPDAVLTGVETRTSSPLRITRNRQYQSLNVRGLYPAGEGAGYAGGIMSAGVDGIEVAEAVAYFAGDARPAWGPAWLRGSVAAGSRGRRRSGGIGGAQEGGHEVGRVIAAAVHQHQVRLRVGTVLRRCHCELRRDRQRAGIAALRCRVHDARPADGVVAASAAALGTKVTPSLDL